MQCSYKWIKKQREAGIGDISVVVFFLKTNIYIYMLYVMSCIYNIENLCTVI